MPGANEGPWAVVGQRPIFGWSLVRAESDTHKNGRELAESSNLRFAAFVAGRRRPDPNRQPHCAVRDTEDLDGTDSVACRVDEERECTVFEVFVYADAVILLPDSACAT